MKKRKAFFALKSDRFQGNLISSKEKFQQLSDEQTGARARTHTHTHTQYEPQLEDSLCPLVLFVGLHVASIYEQCFSSQAWEKYQ